MTQQNITNFGNTHIGEFSSKTPLSNLCTDPLLHIIKIAFAHMSVILCVSMCVCVCARARCGCVRVSLRPRGHK